MTSSDSSDCEDGGFVRVSSANKYPFPPKDIEFALRVKPKGVNSTKLMYTLKKEQKLPYQLELMGKHICLNQGDIFVICQASRSSLVWISSQVWGINGM